MASVYRARDEVLAREVAIKVLHPRLADDPGFLERFRREAMAAARLTHPHVVSIYDSASETADDSTRHYIVMELCSRGSLAEVLSSGALEPDKCAGAGVQICEALTYAHEMEVIHRDIKPGNVLIGGHGALKVSDFGIARAVIDSADLDSTSQVLGTVAYMSPEQLRGEEVDERTDVYSLGALLYEAATGRRPFEADTAIASALKRLNDRPPAPRQIKAGIPKHLDDAIVAALSPAPEDRPSSARELSSALSFSSVDTTVLRVPRPAPQPTAEPPGRNESRWLVTVGVIIVLAILAAVALAAVFDDRSGNGGSNSEDPGGRPLQALQATVSDFDPGGDGTEHPEDAGAAADGNPQTSWETEDYNSTLSSTKAGVGLLFDLSEPADVTQILLTGSSGLDIEIRAGDDAPSQEIDLEVVQSIGNFSGDDVVEVSASARYWLVWITDLPGGGGGSALISEVEFRGD